MQNKLGLLIFVSIAFLSACKKDSNTKKSFTLEMKINGVLWTATKDQAGIYNTQTKRINIGGAKGDETFVFSRDTVNGVGTYSLPSGAMTMIISTGSSRFPYSVSSSNPRSRGSLTLLNSTASSTTGNPNIDAMERPEANFSGVLFDTFNLDSIIITEGKLRYQ